VADKAQVSFIALKLLDAQGEPSAVEGTPISCSTLADGLATKDTLPCLDGVGGPSCCSDPVGSDYVTVAGALYIATNGQAFGAGALKYLGDDLETFLEQVGTEAAGFYNLQITADQSVSEPIVSRHGMYVSIAGKADTMPVPKYSYNGDYTAFTVGVEGKPGGHLSLTYLALSSANEQTLLSLLHGGQMTLTHVNLRNTQLAIAGHAQLEILGSVLDSAAVTVMRDGRLTIGYSAKYSRRSRLTDSPITVNSWGYL
jgi:hypothetical protein